MAIYGLLVSLIGRHNPLTFFRKNREAGSSGNGYGNIMNSYRRGASAEEDFRSVRGTGTVSDEKRERIRKLKELRDSGVMTKEEYLRDWGHIG